MNDFKLFVLDVDGVMTTGQFLYSETGKIFKIFGPDDSDALKLVSKYIKILFVTADKRGFEISKKRISDDMGYPIYLVSSSQRLSWISEKENLDKVIYMGDGLVDSHIFKKIGYSICPQNSFHLTKENADYVSPYNGAERAVADACLHLLEKFFKPHDFTE